MMKVFIADDHELIREGLKKILRAESDISVVGESQSGAETLDRIRESECDVLVLDLGLPDRPGLEVLREVKKILPRVNVLILSMFPEEHFALRSLKDGADGYLSKESAAAQLVPALRRIAGGRKYFSQETSESILNKIQDKDNLMAHETLSDREFQILSLIGSGKTMTEIAAGLNLSVSTVNTHRTHILEKMNMHSNAELMRYAIENKLV